MTVQNLISSSFQTKIPVTRGTFVRLHGHEQLSGNKFTNCQRRGKSPKTRDATVRQCAQELGITDREFRLLSNPTEFDVV